MAIQASELRIGNLIMDSPINGDKIKKVEVLYPNVVFFLFVSHIYNDEKRGIPLTEEWLLKFRLTNVTEELDAEKSFEIKFGRKSFRVVIDDRGLCTVIYQVDIGMNFQELTDVEFVHEFQNLIFALCGEELKLN